MGSVEEVDQRSYQQGQRLKHQAYRARTIWGELDSRSRPILPEHHEGAGSKFALHTYLRCDGCNREHEIATGRGTTAGPVDRPVPKSVQAE